jgi:hypothetical protein
MAHAYPDYYLKSLLFLISVRAALSVLFAIVVYRGLAVEYRVFEILSGFFFLVLSICISRSHQLRNCLERTDG